MVDDDDATLLRRYRRSRDDVAFGRLVGRHAGAVRTIALRCTGNAHAAEDVAQATFLVLSGRTQLAGLSARRHGSLRPWLARTCRHCAANWRRSEARRRRREKVAAVPERVAADPSTPGELAEAVAFALSKLSRRDRRLIELHHLDEQPWPRVAEALRLTPDAAKRAGARAMIRLRESLTARSVVAPASALASALTALARPIRLLPPPTAAAFQIARGTLTMLKLQTAALALSLVAVTGGLVATLAQDSGGGTSAPTTAAAPATTRPAPATAAPTNAGVFEADRFYNEPDAPPFRVGVAEGVFAEVVAVTDGESWWTATGEPLDARVFAAGGEGGDDDAEVTPPAQGRRRIRVLARRVVEGGADRVGVGGGAFPNVFMPEEATERYKPSDTPEGAMGLGGPYAGWFGPGGRGYSYQPAGLAGFVVADVPADLDALPVRIELRGAFQTVASDEEFGGATGLLDGKVLEWDGNITDGTRGPLSGAVFGALPMAYRVEGGVVTLTAVVSRREDGNRLHVIGVGPSIYDELQLLVRQRGDDGFVEIRGEAQDSIGVLWQHWQDYGDEIDPSKVEAVRLRAAPKYVVTMNVAARPTAVVVPEPVVRKIVPGGLPYDVELKDVSLAKAVNYVSRVVNRPVAMDSLLLAREGFDPRQPVSVSVPGGTSVVDALNALGATATPRLKARETADGFRLVPAGDDDNAGADAGRPTLPARHVGVPLRLDGVPFEDVLAFLRNLSDAAIFVDNGAVRAAGVEPAAVLDAEVTLNVDATAELGRVLRLTLGQVYPDLRAFVHRDGGIVVTTAAGLGRWRDEFADDPDAALAPRAGKGE